MSDFTSPITPSLATFISQALRVSKQRARLRLSLQHGSADAKYHTAATRPSLHSTVRAVFHQTQHFTSTRLTLCSRHQAPLQRHTLSAITQRKMPSRSFSSTINNAFETIPENRQCEEEANPGYRAENFYPVASLANRMERSPASYTCRFNGH